ncbi:fungal specific transcription factor domain-containingprotein [Purpureocillium lavendulum]|uniref:Fungal specific transcription factor domain-containingprotein n=1 Tax=Purpureocillium lavendulum TaxID=1247861 RepID=A0AB34G3W7_9HYPO|nr:fungal specific transcription factor domain-containingprotein [Purpureocillium lavendulum]
MEFSNEALPPPSLLEQGNETAAGTRRYRSKSQRPCDLCRARKVLCNIPDPSQPCQLCHRTKRPCTFVATTSKKQKTGPASGHANVLDGSVATHSDLRQVVDETSTQLTESESPEEQLAPEVQPFAKFMFDASWSATAEPNGDLSDIGPPVNDDADTVFDILHDSEIPQLWPMQSPGFSAAGLTAGHRLSPQSVNGFQPVAPGASLDHRANYSSVLVGFSNESDPFILEHFPYNNADEVDFFMVTYRRPLGAKASTGQAPVHILQSKLQASSQGRELMNNTLAISNEREMLDKLVDVETGESLVDLYVALIPSYIPRDLKLSRIRYFRFVFQTLPIISRSQVKDDIPRFVRSASPGLLAGLYALALPFTPWDERLCMNNAYSKPSSDGLWQIAYTCLQKQVHSPHLSTVQIALLLLNHTPFDPVAVESPFAWSLAASMTAIAQELGLHMDPSDWKLPMSEIRLRRRLWWAVVVEHSWRAITHGRPSMLHDEEWNVTPLSIDDFATDDASSGVIVEQADHFMRLCTLTQIANGICRQFFSLRAVSQPQPLDVLIEQAKWPRQQLHEWLQDLPESLRMTVHRDDQDNDLPQSQGSLHNAYFTAHILLFRALLRPIVSKDIDSQSSPSSIALVLQASRSLMQTKIDFVRGLDVNHKSGFWPAYNRHCFCYPGLFCYMLCLQRVEPHMMTADRRLLAKWRNVLRTRMQSWQLLRFAIVKVDALFWKKLDNLIETSAAC